MKLGSRCVVRHRVKFARDLSLREYKDMTDYLAREGRFQARGGLDRDVTRSDERLEAHKSAGRVPSGDAGWEAARAAERKATSWYPRSAEWREARDASLGSPRPDDVEDMVAYLSRTGRFAGRGVDNPIAEGEISGHCFGGDGLFDHSTLVRDLVESGSNVLQSVVTVSRVDAAELRMDSKEAFERFLRAEWPKTIEAFGIIDPKDVRWCAFYHVDARSSLHCHVVTWDDSGRWGGDDLRKVPRQLINEQNARLNKVVVQRQLDGLEAHKSYLRDAYVWRVRSHLGQEIPERVLADLERRREDLGVAHDALPDRALAPDEAEREVASVRAAAPDGRVTQYKRSPAEVRHAAQGVVGRLREADPGLDAIRRDYEEVSEQVGRGTGHTDRVVCDEYGRPRSDIGLYKAKQVSDLDTRAASVVCTVARTADDPLRRAASRGEDRRARQEGLDRQEDQGGQERQDRIERAREAVRGIQSDARRAALAAARADYGRCEREGWEGVKGVDGETLRECRALWDRGRDLTRRIDPQEARDHALAAALRVLSSPAMQDRIREAASERCAAGAGADVRAEATAMTYHVADRVATALTREYDRQDHMLWSRSLSSLARDEARYAALAAVRADRVLAERAGWRLVGNIDGRRLAECRELWERGKAYHDLGSEDDALRLCARAAECVVSSPAVQAWLEKSADHACAARPWTDRMLEEERIVERALDSVSRTLYREYAHEEIPRGGSLGDWASGIMLSLGRAALSSSSRGASSGSGRARSAGRRERGRGHGGIDRGVDASRDAFRGR